MKNPWYSEEKRSYFFRLQFFPHFSLQFIAEGVAPKQSQHAPLSEINWISFKWAWRLSLGATPFVLLAPRSWISGLSYEVSFALEFWVADHLQTKTSNWKSAYAVLYVHQCILLIFKRCTLRGTCTLQKRLSKLLMNSNGYPFKASIWSIYCVQTMMGNSNQLVGDNKFTLFPILGVEGVVCNWERFQ